MNPPLPKQTATITLDGEEVAFTEGETIYEIAERNRKQIPTLCYDPRLEAFGGCRLCVVELEGARNPVASCTTKATPDMVVRTATEDIEKYRRTLLEMVTSENRELDVDSLRGYASQELTTLVNRYEARTGRFIGAQSGTSNTDDKNPFILRDYDLCISCYRCVRVCAGTRGRLRNQRDEPRLPHANHHRVQWRVKRLSVHLLRSVCADLPRPVPLADKKAMRAVDRPGEIEKTRTICPYCGVGCSIDLLTKEDRIVGIHPAMDGPANEGALCVKGQFAFDFVHHPDRLTTPLIRGEDGELHEASWDEALDRAAEGFRRGKR